MTEQALAGIKVLDVSQVAAVPMAARHLADFGADVIHVEHPLRGDSWRVYQAALVRSGLCASSDIDYNWENYNRNKRSLAVDLSQEGGRGIIYKLVAKADVFLTNLRLFEREKFGLEYDTLSQLNSRLIYGSLTGYGKKGPDRNNPGYDTTSYWTRAGVPYMLSLPGIPCHGYRPAFGDNTAALALFSGILVALHVRERTGVGQEVDVSLFHTGVYQISFDIAGALVTGQDYQDWARKPPEELLAEAEAVIARVNDFYRESALSPLTTAYETKDGRSILLAMLQSDLYWSKFCRAIGREDLESCSRFYSSEAREENHVALCHILKETFLARTLAEWKPRLAGIAFSPTQNLQEVINDPQARANDFFVSYDHPTHGRIEGVANPIELNQTPAAIRMPAPEFGQHTEEVLLEYGYTWEDIAQLKEQGIIA